MQIRLPRILTSTLLLACLVLPFAVSTASAQTAAFDTPPRPLKTRPPQYPADLRNQGVSGAVSVLIEIDEKGKVVSAEVKKASNDAFRDPALAAVKQWIFEPAKLAGKAVVSRVTVPLVFSVES